MTREIGFGLGINSLRSVLTLLLFLKFGIMTSSADYDNSENLLSYQ